MNDIAAFLGRYQPFVDADGAELEQLAAGAQVLRPPAGAVILAEDGAVSTGVYVVHEGAVELEHDDEVVDVLDVGEVFGHPSMLTGRAPAFTVRARDRCELILIPADLAVPHLSSAFVAATLRSRMVRTGQLVHAQADVRTAHLGDLVHRPAAICTPQDTVREAARRMADKDVSCILVDVGDGWGVLTDSDLRRKLVAEGLPYETPVSELMVRRAMTVPPDRLAIDAMIDMLDLGIHHLPVVDSRGTPLGIVTATDLMYLEGRTPFAVRRGISKAESPDQVVEAARHLPQTIVALTRAGVSSVDACRVLALSGDTATARLLELAWQRHGTPPCAWAWMALGSVARREQTLASDQDNAFAYDDPGGEEVDSHFAAVCAEVNTDLERCGFGADNSDVLARNRQWRMSRTEWERVLADCLQRPDRSHLVRAAVSFDFRHVTGGLDIVRPLVTIERQAPGHPDFIARLARTATDFTPPLGRRGRLATDDTGRIDLKKRGIIPIVNLTRFHAIAAGITVSATLERLAATEAAGQLSAESTSELREVFELMMRLRLEQQVLRVERGERPGNLVDPGELPPLTRNQMVQAFQAVAQHQKLLGRYVPIGL
ncbi:MAG TPA: putative nucleotidyltransferase substrate binding domain-containing protein [Gaiellales bacterium]